MTLTRRRKCRACGSSSASRLDRNGLQLVEQYLEPELGYALVDHDESNRRGRCSGRPGAREFRELQVRA